MKENYQLQNELLERKGKSLRLIYTHDLDGILLSVNPSGAKTLGYEPEEMTGKSLSAFLTSGAKILFQNYLHEIGKKQEVSGLLSFLTKSGKERIWQYDTILYKEESAYVLVCASDVTDLKRLEKELKEARAAAFESVRLKSEFLANMSHEIRTPMNGIIGMTDLLLDKTLGEVERGYVETIKTSADLLLTIINDILDFSKIEAGKLQIETIDFDLRATIENTVALFAEQVARKRIEIASLIESDVTVALRGDPGRLRQILVNLVGNAVKFTEQGEVLTRVSLEKETDKQVTLRFTVTDTGIGISKDARKYLFHAFSQADGSTSRRFGGSGLGLTISKQLVELMNGQIGVESELGGGSVFWFTVRFEKQIGALSHNVEFKDNLQDLRLLVVDDNATNRQVIAHQTTFWGMKTTEASNADEAIRKLRRATRDGQPFDLVILDFVLPMMNGLDLASAIKKDSLIADVRLILMPSFGKRGHGRQARLAGVNGYLPKPVRQSDLFECIATVMCRDIHQSLADEEKLQTPIDLVTQYTLEENRFIRRERILLVEDNEVNQKIAQQQLEHLGYQVEVVPNGREAVKAIERQNYSLILMDCQMPEMDGYQATSEIRLREGDKKHTPVIAITANALRGDREKCLAAGMDDYLPKPFDKKGLSEMVKRWLQSETAVSAHPAPTSSKKSLTTGVKETKKTIADEKYQPGFADVAARLDVLREEVGSEMLDGFIALFLDDTRARLDRLRPLVAQSDSVEFGREVHALRGSCSNMGANGLANLCAQIEEQAESGNQTDLALFIERLEIGFSALNNIFAIIRRQNINADN